MHLCPCCSEKPYHECCEPVLENQSAPTALSLMRSRFTAYHHGYAKYLYETTHSKTRVNQDFSAIEAWSKSNTWTELEIIYYDRGQQADVDGVVEFKAHFIDTHGHKQVHHERSNFLKENSHWYYSDGLIYPQESTLENKISRNDPCPCGSGKKYKKCCG